MPALVRRAVLITAVHFPPVLIISVYRHSILDNVGWLVGWLVGLSVGHTVQTTFPIMKICMKMQLFMMILQIMMIAT